MPTDSLIENGQKAPSFALKDQNGEIHRLSHYKGQWVVLYFYPRDNTPGCTKQACEFRDEHPKFTKIKAVVLGVSPDDQTSHTKFVNKFDLPFPLLADTERKTCTDYGVWQEKNMYGRKSMGVVRTTYVINPQGKVAHRFDKVKVADHAQAVLDVIDSH